MPRGTSGSYEAYSLNSGALTILAPTGWTCEGFVSTDGGSELAVIPNSEPFNASSYGEPSLSGSADPQAVTAASTGGCQGCAYGATCAYLPTLANSVWSDLAQSPGCGSGIPAGETAGTFGSNVAYFEDPAGVTGAGNPSGGQNPANGVVILQPPGADVDGNSFIGTCTLPDPEHSRCQTILNDFAKRYQG